MVRCILNKYIDNEYTLLEISNFIHNRVSDFLLQSFVLSDDKIESPDVLNRLVNRNN
jgi:hypothetical protein